MRELISALETSRTPVITAHIRPDGDAVGSMVALKRALNRMGTSAQALSPSPVSQGLQFFLDDEEIPSYLPQRDNSILEQADLFVVMDCGDLQRVGRMGEVMKKLKTPMAVIDHHSTNESFGDINYIQPEASSTCMVLIDIIDELGLPLTYDLALPLYVGMVTDSGNFSYPNTGPRTHRQAARLVEAGVKPYRVYRHLHLNQTLEFARLSGLATFDIHLAYQGEVAYSVIQYDLYKKFTPRVDELVNIASTLLAIHGVEVGVLFLEYAPDRIVVEIRASGLINAAAAAKKFEGGGHSGAAGVKMDGEMVKIVFRVLEEIERRIIQARQEGVTEERRSEIWART